MNSPRTARPEELPAIIDLAEHVFADLEKRPRFLERLFPLFLSPANADNLHVITADVGRPVALLGTSPETFVTAGCEIPCGLIGGVCAHENHRGHGYSGLLLDAAYRRLRERGAVLAWISGDRSVYVKSGAEPVWPLFRGVFDGAVPLQALGDRATDIVRATPADIPTVVALHDQEPARFLWRPQWLDVVLPHLMTPDLNAIYLIRRTGRTVAAACLRGRSQTRLFQPGATADMLDWFGDRAALLAALGRIASDAQLAKLSWLFTSDERQILDGLRVAGFTIDAVRTHTWTLKVLDFPGLLQRVQPHLRRVLGNEASRITATESGWCVRRQATDYVTPDEQMAARILFSRPEDYAARWAEVPDDVRELFGRVFPLPLRHYGLNYI